MLSCGCRVSYEALRGRVDVPCVSRVNPARSAKEKQITEVRDGCIYDDVRR
jgi:hypothetical protein